MVSVNGWRPPGRWCTSPELVVLDDLSSALDVETEVELWRNLADAGMTVLAVSHRAVAFERADQVLRLEAGHLIAPTRLSLSRTRVRRGRISSACGTAGSGQVSVGGRGGRRCGSGWRSEGWSRSGASRCGWRRSRGGRSRSPRSDRSGSCRGRTPPAPAPSGCRRSPDRRTPRVVGRPVDVQRRAVVGRSATGRCGCR